MYPQFVKRDKFGLRHTGLRVPFTTETMQGKLNAGIDDPSVSISLNLDVSLKTMRVESECCRSRYYRMNFKHNADTNLL